VDSEPLPSPPKEEPSGPTNSESTKEDKEGDENGKQKAENEDNREGIVALSAKIQDPCGRDEVGDCADQDGRNDAKSSIEDGFVPWPGFLGA